MEEKVGIVGAGKLGGALARALCEAGVGVVAITDIILDRAASKAKMCGDDTCAIPLAELPDDLTLRRNWEYRSMLLGFNRYVTRSKDGKKTDILADTKSITLELPYVTKAGKPVSFTWTLPIKYPDRPREMAWLIDFRHDKFRVVR